MGMCGFDDKKCAICYCADGGCIAAMNDDYFSPATHTQLISRIRNGKYKDDRDLMITTLKTRYGIDYNDREAVIRSQFFSFDRIEQKLCCEERTKTMSKPEILNAKITSTSITMADHGCLTFWITVKGGGWGVSIGGYCIGHGYLGADEFDATGDGLEAMMRIMDVVGVSKWEDLKDNYIRVECNGWGGTVSKIGNITEDRWFDLKEFFESKQKEG